jgi:Ser/Thr protein kinase RdoA (MazF antagonist)
MSKTAVMEIRTSAMAPLFPVTHSFLFGDAVLSCIGREYDLEYPATCRLLKPALNDTYLLTTRHDRYVVRVYRASREASEIGYELELLLYLSLKGVPVSVPIPTRNGQLAFLLSAPEGPRHVAIFTYAPGKPLTWAEPTHCQLAGRLLAAIHSTSDDFGSVHVPRSLDAPYLIDRPLELVRSFLTDRPIDWEYLQELGARLRTRLASAGRDLDWGVCHGDFNTKNIHLARTDEVVALDFEYCGQGWRLLDFAPARKAADDRKTDAIWESFLRGYTEVRVLPAVDLESVPLFCALRLLGMLGTFAENVNEWGMRHLSEKKLDSWMSALRRWETEYFREEGAPSRGWS